MKDNPRIKPIEQATNRTWDEWMQFMDSVGAKQLTHHEIATKVLEQLMGRLENPGWWAQAVTVAYEQYSGRRLPGQQPDGKFQTSVSKAIKLDMKELMDAWVAFAAGDTAVQALAGTQPRVGGTDKRLTWRTKAADGSAITIISEPKPNGSAAVIAQHLDVPTQEQNNQAKETWTTILSRFVASL